MDPQPKDSTIRSSVLSYCLVTAILFGVAGLSIKHLPMSPEPGKWSRLDNDWLDGWTRGDGGWYRTIATDGYHFAPQAMDPVPFFPSYPLLMRGLAVWFGEPLLAGILISLLAGLGFAVLFPIWCRIHHDRRQATMALWVWLLYPFSFFVCGAVYSEALFVLTAISAFCLLESDRPLAAGLMGAVCTATRPFGLAVVPALLIRAWERSGVIDCSRGRLPRINMAAWRWRDTLVLVSLAGIISYWMFLWSSFGDPLVYTKATAAWGNKPGPHAWFKLGVFELWGQWPWGSPQLNNLFQAGLTGLAFILIPAVIRRFGWGYGVYTFVVLIIPTLSNHSFTDMGRYILPAFPCFAVLGAWLSERRWLAYPALAGSAAALVLLLSRFARWYYVG